MNVYFHIFIFSIKKAVFRYRFFCVNKIELSIHEKINVHRIKFFTIFDGFVFIVNKF